MKGWRDVFSFTFMQNVKGKSFKVALVGIASLIFIIFLAINIIVAAVTNDDKEDKENVITETNVDKIHIVNSSDITDIDFQKLAEESGDWGKISLVMETEELNADEAVKALDDNSRDVFVGIQKYSYNSETETYKLYEDMDKEQIVYRLTVYLKEGGALDNTKDRENISEIVEQLAGYFDKAKYNFIGINDEGMELLNSQVTVETVDIEEANQTLTEILAKIFIPMIVTMLVYMLVLLYGQSLSKIIIVEKSSKLMETLLISLQPYAIVFGKIFAMFSVAMVQIATWITSGILGYIVGDKIASSLFSKYENPLYTIIDIFKVDSSSAFTLTSVLLGILVLVIGFFMYCVMSALFSSGISKPEEVSNGDGVFQIVVVIGFLGAYLMPAMEISDTLVHVLRYIPITAAFMLPSDVILGNSSIATSLISLGIMVALTVVMIYLTGKIYKKKVF